MSTGRPGWLDEPEHEEPVELGQALAEWTAGHHRGRTYVTEVSVPKLGDDGIQRLCSKMLVEPDHDREAGR